MQCLKIYFGRASAEAKGVSLHKYFFLSLCLDKPEELEEQNSCAVVN